MVFERVTIVQQNLSTWPDNTRMSISRSLIKNDSFLIRTHTCVVPPNYDAHVSCVITIKRTREFNWLKIGIVRDWFKANNRHVIRISNPVFVVVWMLQIIISSSREFRFELIHFKDLKRI